MSQEPTPGDGGNRFLRTPLFTPQNQLFLLNDLNAIREGVGGVFKPHDLSPLRPGERVSASMHHVSRGRLSLNRLEYGATVDIDPGRLESFYLVQVPIQGRARIKCGGHSFISTPELASLISPDLPLWMRWEADAPQLALRIDQSEMRHHCAQHLGYVPDKALEFSPELDLRNPGGRYFLQLLEMLVDAIAQTQHPIHQPLVLKQFESVLLNALIYGQPHNFRERMEGDGRPRGISPHFVRRTEEYMRAHAHEPLTIEQLAEYAGVSVRTLFAGFREFCDTSPMAYLRNLRLEQVHLELSRQPQASVTDVAFKWGFAHLGRFAQEYKRRYGCLPSETLRFRAE
ncbi:AraC family transcriptional regulator [Metapseudomonas boanensis]|uniref:AraC family transcriptional regulator n=1 Tax=Metapseudomonas boanensis TaxID=2822138 RepID=A0ABS5XG51_9GAMM|nr:AraC family transcriptional regulator [Pseudomonas boanensis]MBT8766666.1 AraC family transcriptional regulator [Pseudomonas boanensis]